METMDIAPYKEKVVDKLDLLLHKINELRKFGKRIYIEDIKHELQNSQ